MANSFLLESSYYLVPAILELIESFLARSVEIRPVFRRVILLGDDEPVSILPVRLTAAINNGEKRSE